MLTLQTERLTLRPWTLDDTDFLFDLYSRWEVQRFLGREPRVMTDRADAVARAERLVAQNDPVHGIWAITDAETARPYGALLLKELPASGADVPLRPSGETEIGWHLHPDAWGHGYASEAASRVLRHAFDNGLDRVLAVTYPQNEASQRVALRIGMRDLGLTEDYYNTTCRLFGIDRG
ncbi:GNAT family N-acetyltransferase [Humibacter ginsenosidimutans]|uniref:GNAT family N-acetyltransferase n=1 Tax=Humibacter ginsenosidimutans TaxID=2599293 RepID=A0A5B8M3F4_9MICO|nr:GNAT family N-acetyltransferase [Humibacter ginsenosidimutans]QDZ14883.1 GNAT family N-acetyltransferase [Humibacter ginsenosidimutans]